MAEFNVRADEVNVEQIMHQIRARIREKRGVDYTEEQIQELAKIKLERFLDPKGVRSDLLERFQQSDVPPTYEFDDTTLIRSGNPLVGFMRAQVVARQYRRLEDFSEARLLERLAEIIGTPKRES